MSETEQDTNRIEELQKELTELKSKNRWAGKGGLWSTFRAIGRSFYNDKEMKTEAKKEQLAKDIDAFVKERLN